MVLANVAFHSKSKTEWLCLVFYKVVHFEQYGFGYLKLLFFFIILRLLLWFDLLVYLLVFYLDGLYSFELVPM